MVAGKSGSIAMKGYKYKLSQKKIIEKGTGI
jgi:hypothetical protein